MFEALYVNMGSSLAAESKGAFHLLGLAELKELVLAGVNGKRKSTPREYARASCAVSQVFDTKSIGNYSALSSAIFGTQNFRAFRE